MNQKQKAEQQLPKFRLNLFADRVVVRADKAEDITKGGIIIPASAKKEPPAIGKVVGISDQLQYEWRSIDSEEALVNVLGIGDKVLYSQFAGVDIEIDGYSYKVLQITDVIGTLDPKEE